MSDAMLTYLKSIDDKTTRIEEKLDSHSNRLSSLEETRAAQRGIMAAGGALVTVLSGIAGWFGSHN